MDGIVVKDHVADFINILLKANGQGVFEWRSETLDKVIGTAEKVERLVPKLSAQARRFLTEWLQDTCGKLLNKMITVSDLESAQTYLLGTLLQNRHLSVAGRQQVMSMWYLRSPHTTAVLSECTALMAEIRGVAGSLIRMHSMLDSFEDEYSDHGNEDSGDRVEQRWQHCGAHVASVMVAQDISRTLSLEGKAVCAREMQVLFAEASSGAAYLEMLCREYVKMDDEPGVSKMEDLLLALAKDITIMQGVMKLPPEVIAAVSSRSRRLQELVLEALCTAMMSDLLSHENLSNDHKKVLQCLLTGRPREATMFRLRKFREIDTKEIGLDTMSATSELAHFFDILITSTA